MKGIIICIINLFTFVASAQVKRDTIYYNADWKKTTQAKAAYFRVIYKDSNVYRVEDHYKNGDIQMTGSYKTLNPEFREGYFRFFSDNNVLNSEGNWKNNKRDGIWKTYYPNGKLWFTENYKNDKQEGEFISYYPSGKIKRKDIYRDTVVTGNCYDESGNEVRYYPFKEMPKFNGNLLDYLRLNMHYPEVERRANIHGTVYVQFSITKDGSVTDVEIIRSVPSGPGLDKEAIRIISTMPKWKPGRLDGEPVQMSYNIPLDFELK